MPPATPSSRRLSAPPRPTAATVLVGIFYAILSLSCFAGAFLCAQQAIIGSPTPSRTTRAAPAPAPPPMDVKFEQRAPPVRNPQRAPSQVNKTSPQAEKQPAPSTARGGVRSGWMASENQLRTGLVEISL
uniref:Uncharacterized protein n=1 Tax=Hemiselmis andersenii TaxID=464988 RepID=A0A6U4U9Y6_HEMAN|mmetsp:Transcript_22904/g.55778  ORF Transcript_22904/g.55778 Transcript_22904/m.55778 type:complete len:130 (+) Transcript_22904:230-619(+)